jgi:uroporphyrinogen-III synthase
MSQNSLRVVSLESRQAPEMLRLLERNGCTTISAPSMREIPLTDQEEAFRFGTALLAGDCDILVLLTGVGTRMLIDALSTRHAREDVLAAFGRCVLACRGPKPVAVLKQLGLRPTFVAPEPNTWQDLVALLDNELPLSGRTVHVQLYGRSNEPLLDALRLRGANVHSVAIYAWSMPEDTAPLTAAIDVLCRGEAEVVLFTSAQQLEHLYLLAEQLGRATELTTALRTQVACASVGPVTSEALVARGLPVDLTPEHPKMGHIVQLIAREGAAIVARKRNP